MVPRKVDKNIDKVSKLLQNHQYSTVLYSYSGIARHKIR